MTNDGGPAFPQPIIETRDGAITHSGDGYGIGGMSLRDYFAAKAMQGIMGGGWKTRGEDFDTTPSPDVIARDAYLMADAMLEAKEKQS